MLSESEISVPVINAVQEELSEMLTYFKFIQKERVSFSNHLEALDSKDGSIMIVKKLKQEIKHLRAEEDNMIVSMKKLLLTDSKMKQDFAPQEYFLTSFRAEYYINCRNRRSSCYCFATSVYYLSRS